MPQKTIPEIYAEWTHGDWAWGDIELLVEQAIAVDPEADLAPFSEVEQQRLRQAIENLASFDSYEDVTTTFLGTRHPDFVETAQSKAERERNFYARRDGARAWLRRHSP